MPLKPLPALLLCAALGALTPPVLAAPLAGVTNAQGYGVHQVQLQSAGLFTFKFLSGLPDATLSLFDSSGQHLLSNDDQFQVGGPLDLKPVLTLDLAAGSYSLLVSHCCSFLGALAGTGATQTTTDGYNSGDYYVGGSSTLDSMTTFLDGFGGIYAQVQNAPYLLDLSPGLSQNQVPAPTSLLLAGSALALLGRRWRRA